MKKAALLIAFLFLISVPASASSPRMITANPVLSFSETTANCSCYVSEGTNHDYVVVTMKLQCGNTVIKQWTQSGAGSVYMSKNVTVTKGETYTLTLDVMVNGTSRSQYSIARTC